MDLSIIIVNYNAKDLLKECLRSLETNISNVDHEIWVVDNASTDGSYDTIKEELPNVKLVQNNENVGFAKANNMAIKRSSGDFVLLLNPDTVVLSNAVQKLFTLIKENELIGVVGPKVLNSDGTIQLACRRSIPTPWVAFSRLVGLNRAFPKSPRFNKYNLTYLNESEISEVEAISGSCMMVRRSALDEVGLLDESFFMYGEDLDWCYRFLKKGWKVYYNPEAQIIHYHGASSKQRKLKSSINFHSAMYLFHKKHFAREMPGIANFFIYSGIFIYAICAIMLNLILSIFRK